MHVCVCVCVCVRKRMGVCLVQGLSLEGYCSQLFFHLPASDHMCAFFRSFMSTLNRGNHICVVVEYMEKYNKFALNTKYNIITMTIIIIIEIIIIHIYLSTSPIIKIIL